MAILKRGSTGRPVEELQNLLNKFGVRPQLTVDGIFGPLTDAGLRSAQKKLQLTVDGKAGERTMAAVRYGRPLPVMEARSFAGKTVEVQANQKFNATSIQSSLRLSNKIDEIDVISDRERQIISKTFTAMATPQANFLKLVTQVEKLQSDFDKLLLTKPALAEKNAKLCKSLEPRVLAMAEQIYKQIKELNEHRRTLVNAVNDVSKAVTQEDKVMGNALTAYENSMRGLMR